MYLYYSKKPVTGSADGWEVHYPGSVMQFICLVNSLFPQDPLWTSPDFLTSLASAVFPSETPEVRLLGTVPFSVQFKIYPRDIFCLIGKQFTEVIFCFSYRALQVFRVSKQWGSPPCSAPPTQAGSRCVTSSASSWWTASLTFLSKMVFIL